MVKVFIIVLNFNGREDTLDCLESLTQLRATDCQLETVVVDNGSTDGSVEAIRKKISGVKPPIHFIENEENLGFAEGNNVGIRLALEKGADFILVLNNDTVADQDLAAELLEATAVQKDAGIFGPKIYFAPGFEYHKGRYKGEESGRVIWYAGGQIDWANVLFSHRGVDEVDQGQYDQKKETDYISGCAMLIRREVLEKVGLFDRKYFAYLEDVDLCQRARAAGFKMRFVPRAVLWHKVSQTAGGIGSRFQDYYITRNRLLFGLRFASPRSKFALVRESCRLLFSSPQKRKAVLDFYLNRFGKSNV